VVIAAEDDGLQIRQLVPEGGAADANLRAGDVIIAVEGIAVIELGFEGALQRIRGPEGSAVTLTIRRADGTVVDILVYRKRIRV
jgi:carboxyl-terminal processing protease